MKTIDINKFVAEKQKEKGITVICLMVHGSHLYGMNTPNSDIDYKGVYIPSKKSILMQENDDEIRFSTGDKDGKNTSEDTDIVLYSLPRFMKLLISGETIAIDMIHVNKQNLIYSNLDWETIVHNRSHAYSKNMNAFMGYVKKQAHKYGVRGSRIKSIETVIEYLDKKLEQCIIGFGIDKPKLNSIPQIYMGIEGIAVTDQYVETFDDHLINVNGIMFSVAGSKYTGNTRIDLVIESLQKKLDAYGHRAKLARNNEGLDFKALSHALRCGYQLIEIYETNDLKYPLANREHLIDVKLGKCDFLTQIEPELNEVVDKVEKLAKESAYSDESDKAILTRITMNIMEKYI